MGRLNTSLPSFPPAFYLLSPPGHLPGVGTPLSRHFPTHSFHLRATFSFHAAYDHNGEDRRLGNEQIFCQRRGIPSLDS